MNMIKELWYGNIIPQEDGIFNKPQFKELLGLQARCKADAENAIRTITEYQSIRSGRKRGI